MENKKEKRVWTPWQVIALVFVFFAFLFFRGSINTAWGGASDNLAGWAWSSDFGWISFNCNNPPYPSTCGVSDYGVKIKDFSMPGETFNFAGYAWSSNAGWISFNDKSAPDYSFNAHCKSSCDSSSSCTACYDPDDGKIYGWAKVLSLGNDGWIKLRGTTTNDIDFGVSIDQTSASGSFIGWAWNGNTEKYKGLGWISFNCGNPEVNSCASGNYFVRLASSHLPVPTNLSAPNYSTSTACALKTAKGASLNWQFSDQDAGQTQWAYQVILNSANTTSSPLFDTGKVVALGGPSQQIVPSATFAYNTHYYWWVRVWDTFGFVSRWMQFNTGTPGHTLTDNAVDNGGNPLTFTTYRREFPEAYFSRIPFKPVAEAAVTSTDRSFYYLDTNDGPYACSTSTCQWSWSSPNALTNSATTSSSTVMTFPYGPNEQIFLKVKDNGVNNYSCVTSSLFFVDKLPIWTEKKAE